MPDYAKDDALSFIESMRLTLAGRAGFRWLDAKLVALASYIERLATENEQMRAYLERKGLTERFEADREEGESRARAAQREEGADPAADPGRTGSGGASGPREARDA